EAFGAAGIIQSQSTIEMNLRFPGQYFDQETGSHYKFHRDYRPTAGRYVEFDPEGLYGGVNSFTYAGSNAISNGDPQGRFAQVIGPAIIWCARTPACVGGIIGIIIAAPKPPVPAPSTSAGGSDSGSGSGAGEGSDSGGASSTKDGVSEWNKKPPIQRGLYTCRYVMYFPMDLCKKGICPEFVTGRGWAKTLQEAMLMARMEAQGKIPINCGHQHHGQMWCRYGGDKPFMPGN
ncbi:RHS repeat-associated core domain-containing protein, partial [Comamonadaceae bacterium OH2545_COT-014]